MAAIFYEQLKVRWILSKLCIVFILKNGRTRFLPVDGLLLKGFYFLVCPNAPSSFKPGERERHCKNLYVWEVWLLWESLSKSVKMWWMKISWKGNLVASLINKLRTLWNHYKYLAFKVLNNQDSGGTRNLKCMLKMDTKQKQSPFWKVAIEMDEVCME